MQNEVENLAASKKEQYKVFARKYRPQRLQDLTGHDVLVETITNAINSNRLHHAFLLTGTRGIGKTTTARILALSLNCIGEDGQGTSPTAAPCLKCSHCKQIMSGSHSDVMEFDAASKTGVDSMREIIDSCVYPPMSARYKVYIIDEVHMLSKAAFNSLLKTLEEPPHNVKFIFATTEMKKVPITIVSRCQKFVLHNLSVSELSQNLKNICEKEGIEFEDDAIDSIAKMAKGSVRDSLSLLDQIVSSVSSGIANKNDSGSDNTKTKISAEAVKLALSMPDEIDILSLVHAILNNDKEKTFEMTTKISSYNQDTQYVFGVISDILSNTLASMFLSSANSASSSNGGANVGSSQDEEVQEIIREHAEKLDSIKLLNMIDVIVSSSQEREFLSPSQAMLIMAAKLMFVANVPKISDIAL